MLSPKSLLFLLQLVFFALVPHEVSQILHPHIQHSAGLINGRSGDALERILLETSVGDHNSSLVLAEKRTRRKDPSNDFKYYTGGWNISDDHYIFSVTFTAVPLFAIATIWFIGSGVTLLLICCCCCYRCCRRNTYDYSKTAYAFCFFLLSLFTISAIVGCVVLYTGQGKFNDSTTDTLDYVVSQSNDTVYNLKNVSSILSLAKDIEVDHVSLPLNVKNDIDRVHKMINDAASNLQFETRKNENDIKQVLKDVSKLFMLKVEILFLLLMFLILVVFSILGLQFLVYILVILGWILVTATLILCGIFLALHNITGDTCVAMNEWVDNPMAHTALDDILPCVDNATAEETMSQSKEVEFQLVGMVNYIINNISNINPPPFQSFLNFNQSGPLVPILCNPLTANKTDRICLAGELQFNNATKVWRNYVCQVSSNDTCTTVGRLTPKMYQQMSVAVNVSAGLTEYGPFLTGLMDCSFVRETFSGIHKDHCPDLNRFSELVYIGLAMVSGAVMVSLVLWVLCARERKHRRYTKLVIESAPSPVLIYRQRK
ncbi:hypothetical protein R6Q57_020825 [Mikania cordata]